MSELVEKLFAIHDRCGPARSPMPSAARSRSPTASRSRAGPETSTSTSSSTPPTPTGFWRCCRRGCGSAPRTSRRRARRSDPALLGRRPGRPSSSTTCHSPRGRRGVVWVPLEGRQIPVLDCASLMIFKSFFDRTKDWADIEAVAVATPEDIETAAQTLADLVGQDDPAFKRLARDHRSPIRLSVSCPQQMGNTGIATATPVARAGTVDVLVGLLAELDEATESGVFYDRVCRAVCSLTTMERAALLLHDDAYRAVIPVGSLRARPGAAEGGRGDARRDADRPQSAGRGPGGRGDRRRSPATCRRATPSSPTPQTLTCTPISAARRWLGVIFADRGGEEFQLERRRAGDDADPGPAGGADRQRRALDRAARKRAAAGRTGRADPRAARERDPAALRRRPGDRLRAGA